MNPNLVALCLGTAAGLLMAGYRYYQSRQNQEPPVQYGKSITLSVPPVRRRFEVVMVGKSGVGKTSIIKRFVDGTYSTYSATVGIDFRSREVTLGGKQITLNISDTAGQIDFQNEPRLRNANAIIFVYDITNEESLKELTSLFKMCSQYATENVIKMVVGNKSDNKAQRKVRVSEGNSLAVANGAEFLETSAKADTEISNLFSILAGMIAKV